MCAHADVPAPRPPADDLPADALPELPTDAWRRAGRQLLAKMIAEFAYEQILTPVAVGDDYRVQLPGGVGYLFRARRGLLDAWRIDPDSLRRDHGGRRAPADDPVTFVLDARAALGLDGARFAELLRELLATQTGDVRLALAAPSAAELADLSYVELEAHQNGHPCMVLNKGRLGFSASDAARYAPEARRSLRLVWIAVDPELAGYQGVPGLDAERLVAEELDAETRDRFTGVLRGRRGGGAASGHVWLPVHPWHFDQAVVPLFAPYLADGRIVTLGVGPDRYRPLASVRTLANVDHPGRRNVKLPLLIRNTLVWRGLDVTPTAAAPQVTSWLQGIRGRDAFLRATGMVPLGEVASVVVRHPLYEQLPDAPYRYHELLAAVWREPVEGYLRPGETARTLAALLGVDTSGRALVAELVARSGLVARDWLSQLFAALLPPLLHYLYRYGVAFCPHGENTVVIYEADVPVRIAVKDFAEDISLLDAPLPEYADLPPRADAVLLRWQGEDLCHSILSAVFAGHFRFLAGIAEAHLGVPEHEFWALVRDEVLTYHKHFPELAERFDTFDLFTPRFDRIALNREQLLGGGYHDRVDRDAPFDLSHGSLVNPLS